MIRFPIRLILALTLIAAPAAAIEVAKPDGGAVGYIPDYGVTAAVVAVNINAIGEGLAVLERQANGLWYFCGTCMPSPQNLANEVAFSGGVVPYIEKQRPAL